MGRGADRRVGRWHRQAQLEEQTNKARAVFRLLRRELNNKGFEGIVTEEPLASQPSALPQVTSSIDRTPFTAQLAYFRKPEHRVKFDEFMSRLGISE